MVCCGASEGNFRRDRCGEVENGNGTLGLCHRCARGGGRWRINAETHNVDADNAVGGRHHKFRGQHNAELKIMLEVVVVIVLVVVYEITKNKNNNGNDNDDENNGTMVIILAISRCTTKTNFKTVPD